MEEAIRRVAELPAGQQDVVASIVLAEIDAEDVWAREFVDDADLLDEWAIPSSALDDAGEMTGMDFGGC